MKFPLYISKRIIGKGQSKQKVSRPIVLIAISGIALGLSVMLLTVAIVQGFQKEIRDKVIGFGSHIQITGYDSNTSDEPSPIVTNPTLVNTLKQNPDIIHIQAFAAKNGIIKTKTDNEGVLLRGVGTDYDFSFLQKNIKLGTLFSTVDSVAQRQIILSKYLTDKLGLQVGEKMRIFFLTRGKSDAEGHLGAYQQRVREYIIAGIYNTGFEEFDKKTAFIQLNQIQRLNYWKPNQIGGYEVQIKNYTKIDELGEFVYNNIGQELNAQTVKELNTTIFSWLELQDVNAIIVIVLMVLVAAINMISALLVLILERTNMIGILKALGAGNWLIQKIFLYNAAYLIGVGLLIGNVLGLSLCWIQHHFGLISLNPATYYVDKVPVFLTFSNWLLLNICTLVVCLLMLVLPSFLVSRISPIKAIQFR